MTDQAATLTHGCVRCGAQIPLADAMCEQCNPLGLRQPAASQAHGTVFLAVGVAIVALAVLARVSVAGIGPFRSSLSGVTATADGLTVAIEITNDGAAGAVMCRIGDPTIPGIGPETAYVQSPLIGAGETLTFSATVLSLGTEPRPLSVACGDGA